MAVEKIVNVTIKDNAADVEKDINKLNKSGENLESTFKDVNHTFEEVNHTFDEASHTFDEASHAFEEAGHAFEEAGHAFEGVNHAFEDVNHTFEEVYGDLQPLTTRLGEAEDRMYELALAGKQNTEEYRELLKATANYRQVQIQTDLVVDTAAQTMTQKLGGALEGAASGFALVQGAMGLFGSESEEVEKALLKVQSAMALAQGIEGVRTALPLFKSFGTTIKNVVVGAFTSLRGAIISTGIGALVVALGMAADAMGLFGSATDDAADANQKLADSIAKQNTELERRIGRSLKQMELQRKQAEADGVTEQELFKMRIEAITQEEEFRKRQYEENKRRIEELKHEKSEEVKSEIENLEKINSALYDSLWNRIQGENDYDIKRREIELEFQAFKNNQLIQEEKKADDKRQRDIEKAKERARQLQEIERQRLINLQNLENDFLAELEQVESEYFDGLLSDQEREIRVVEDKYFRLLELAEQYKVDATTLELARESELATIRNKYKEEDVETTQVVEDDKTAIKLQAASNVLNILSLLSNIGDQESKKTFQLQKAVGLAQATIDTYKGAASAYANTVGGPVIKGIAAGVAVAAGLANVKKIASTQFSPSSTSTPSITSPTISSPSTQQLSTPNFNVVGATGISQTEELQPVKAYVVSGDVTTAQALDRNRIQNATF